MSAAVPEGRAIEHEIRTTAPPETVMSAITTDDGLSAWHGAASTAPGPEGDVAFDPERHPGFRWDVAREGSTVTWTCVTGPGNSVGTTAVYDCDVADDGRTVVRLTHNGWEPDDDAFRRCNTYWGALLFQLERYLETGEHRPVFT